MKIIKRYKGEGLLFDTINPQFSEKIVAALPTIDTALHNNISESEFNFLSRFFDQDHQIFTNFGESYYYLAESQMTLEEFAEKHCDGLYNPKLGDDDQCGGWYQLKHMVQNHISPTESNMGAFHPNLRKKIVEYWGYILKFKCG